MNRFLRYVAALACLTLLIFLCIPTIARAQDVPLPDPQFIAEAVTPWINDLARKHPAIVSALVVMGALRFAMKPLFSILAASQTGGPVWSARVQAAQRSPWYCAIRWLLDFGASVKIDHIPRAGGPVLLLALGAFAFCGCAGFQTRQTDTEYWTNGLPKRATTTIASSHTFFDSKSALAKWRASQSEKTQGASVGSLGQESSGSNAVQVLRIVVESAAAGATRAVVP